jgi:hypothetical protein
MSSKNDEKWREISGEHYDWTASLKPERPWIHDYTKTYVSKIDLAFQNSDKSGTVVCASLDQTLEILKQLDAITLGVPKIIYLVGWQYYGHDSKYPAWHEVNGALKRPGDASALESLRWLFKEAKKYNVTLSLHINMEDAYEDSPLFKPYADAGVLYTNEDGTLRRSVEYEGAYIVNYKREWESGLAKKRIDDLCEMLPIREAGTIHLDTFHCYDDIGHGDTLDEMQAARNKIVRYWRDLGVDVTSELLYYEGSSYSPKYEQLVGLQPHCWLFSQTLQDYIRRPASLICGGAPTYHRKYAETHMYPELFGTGCGLEGVLYTFYPKAKQKLNASDVFARRLLQLNGSSATWREAFLGDFLVYDLKQMYLNTLDRISATVERDGIKAEFSDGVTTELRDPPGYKRPLFTERECPYFTRQDRLVSKRGAVMQFNDDVFFPAVWLSDSAIVYSRNGGNFVYDAAVIMDWTSNENVTITDLGAEGPSGQQVCAALQNGKITLNLSKNSAAVIQRTTPVLGRQLSL